MPALGLAFLTSAISRIGPAAASAAKEIPRRRGRFGRRRTCASRPRSFRGFDLAAFVRDDFVEHWTWCRENSQCLKCRRPVKIIAMPCWLQAAIDFVVAACCRPAE